ncbi:unknown [Firmicutes bacterium CAG:24]|nr:unknown [Firmicutes bacterium CAG:24]
MEQMTELEAECRHRYRVRSIREDDYGWGKRAGGGWSSRLVKSVRRAFGRPCLLNWRMKTDSSVCSGKRITICMNSRSRRAIR